MVKTEKRLLSVGCISLVVASLFLVRISFGEKTAVDPVCGMKIEITDETPKVEYKGKTYYFCMEDDRKEFLKNPEKYIKEEHKEHKQMEHKHKEHKQMMWQMCPMGKYVDQRSLQMQ